MQVVQNGSTLTYPQAPRLAVLGDLFDEKSINETSVTRRRACGDGLFFEHTVSTAYALLFTMSTLYATSTIYNVYIACLQFVHGTRVCNVHDV